MLKNSLFLIIFSFLGLTACGGPYVYLEGNSIPNDSYYGDDLAGETYTATHVEFGIGTGALVPVDPGSLQISFDPYAEIIIGNKNCNAFEAVSVWYEFGLALDFTLVENSLCPLDLIGFPEDVYLDDTFEVEVYFELGQKNLVLYSGEQDVTIFLN